MEYRMPSRIVPIPCPYAVGAVTTYFVDGAQPALIDTGGAAHPRTAIAAALHEHGRSLDEVATIVNTHGHWDHAGGNAKIAAARPNIEILIHEAGAALLVGPAPHLGGYATAAPRLLAEPAVVDGVRRSFPQLFEPGAPATRLLLDGDRVDLGAGVVLDALATPGHSEDHLAFFWEREGLLIAGDAAQGTGSRSGIGPLYFGSVAQARVSIARLRDIPFRTLHLSHPFGRLGTDDRAAAYDAPAGRDFLDDSLAALDLVEESVHQAVKDEPGAPFPTIARRASQRLLDAAPWPLCPDPDTGVPPNLAPTLHDLWCAAVA